MKEIKFRAWDVADKEMREVALLRWEDGRMAQIAGYWPGTRNNGWTDYDPREGKYVLMQFTSLKDRDGKEVYEGDVLQDDSGKNFEVLERVGAFMLERKMSRAAGDDDSGWQFDTLQNQSDGDETLPGHRVIGNAYENPELLIV